MRRTRGVGLFDNGVAVDDDNAAVGTKGRDVVEIEFGHGSGGSVRRKVANRDGLVLYILLLPGTRKTFLLVSWWYRGRLFNLGASSLALDLVRRGACGRCAGDARAVGDGIANLVRFELENLLVFDDVVL